MKRTLEEIKSVMKAKNYAFFENGDFNLNIIAVRENDVFENTFSDTLYVIYKEKGQWQMQEYDWTTLAGVLGFGGEQNPLTAQQTGTGVSGVAVIVEGQYRGVYRFIYNPDYSRLWLQYPYFDQIEDMNYYRDNDKNGTVTRGKIYTGNYKTNLHRMSNNGVISKFVNYWNVTWSQGCNGNCEPDFRKLVDITIKSTKIWGDIYTYTLLNAKDF